MIHRNGVGKISSVKVMLRPLKALQAVVPQMGVLLAHGAAPGAGPTGQRNECV